MKKKITQKIQVEIAICNICGTEVTKEPFNMARLAVVRGLFKTADFHAHEGCINKVVRGAFKKFVSKK